MHDEEMDEPIPLRFFKVHNGKEVEIGLTVNGEENIAFTGNFINAHRAEDLEGRIVWQGKLH